ncbi:porin family protein [Paraglaciecola aquimarina]|uniref:Porin family protein n=1 Tax=Paraglaciecola algarum TaxID=3050085 RepID=A0ABS9DA74_9ALTE|nr:outer membrane beta-barrel protein [Paraglaciecola sp. G1-23]MCF2949813.1 porin family protein [Paraglaciecola sp. G1-23]
MIKKIGLLLATSLFALQTASAERTYTVFSLGFSELEYAQQETDGMGYKLGVGYQFHPQWYVETGYQQLVNESLFVSETPSSAQFESAEDKLQADALYLSVLGKASGKLGELFYRLGVLKTDVRGQELYAGERTCDMGAATLVSTDTLGVATICDYDNSGVAGTFGIGFDYFIGARTMLRSEIEYIKGSDDLTLTSFSVGLRYNF